MRLAATSCAAAAAATGGGAWALPHLHGPHQHPLICLHNHCNARRRREATTTIVSAAAGSGVGVGAAALPATSSVGGSATPPPSLSPPPAPLSYSYYSNGSSSSRRRYTMYGHDSQKTCKNNFVVEQRRFALVSVKPPPAGTHTLVKKAAAQPAQASLSPPAEGAISQGAEERGGAASTAAPGASSGATAAAAAAGAVARGSSHHAPISRKNSSGGASTQGERVEVPTATPSTPNDKNHSHSRNNSKTEEDVEGCGNNNSSSSSSSGSGGVLLTPVGTLDMFAKGRLINFIKRNSSGGGVGGGSGTDSSSSSGGGDPFKTSRYHQSPSPSSSASSSSQSPSSPSSSSSAHMTYRGEVRLSVRRPDGTVRPVHGIGYAADAKSAAVAAAMHAERWLDELGVHIFALSSMQQRHALAARAQGRYAPFPGDFNGGGSASSSAAPSRRGPLQRPDEDISAPYPIVFIPGHKGDTDENKQSGSISSKNKNTPPTGGGGGGNNTCSISSNTFRGDDKGPTDAFGRPLQSNDGGSNSGNSNNNRDMDVGGGYDPPGGGGGAGGAGGGNQSLHHPHRGGGGGGGGHHQHHHHTHPNASLQRFFSVRYTADPLVPSSERTASTATTMDNDMSSSSATSIAAWDVLLRQIRDGSVASETAVNGPITSFDEDEGVYEIGLPSQNGATNEDDHSSNPQQKHNHQQQQQQQQQQPNLKLLHEVNFSSAMKRHADQIRKLPEIVDESEGGLYDIVDEQAYLSSPHTTYSFSFINEGALETVRAYVDFYYRQERAILIEELLQQEEAKQHPPQQKDDEHASRTGDEEEGEGDIDSEELMQGGRANARAVLAAELAAELPPVRTFDDCLSISSTKELITTDLRGGSEEVEWFTCTLNVPGITRPPSASACIGGIRSQSHVDEDDNCDEQESSSSLSYKKQQQQQQQQEKRLRRFPMGLAVGKAQTRLRAMVLCAMHAERIIDESGGLLFPYNHALQSEHAATCAVLGRWAMEPAMYEKKRRNLLLQQQQQEQQRRTTHTQQDEEEQHQQQDDYKDGDDGTLLKLQLKLPLATNDDFFVVNGDRFVCAENPASSSSSANSIAQSSAGATGTTGGPLLLRPKLSTATISTNYIKPFREWRRVQRKAGDKSRHRFSEQNEEELFMQRHRQFVTRHRMHLSEFGRISDADDMEEMRECKQLLQQFIADHSHLFRNDTVKIEKAILAAGAATAAAGAVNRRNGSDNHYDSDYADDGDVSASTTSSFSAADAKNKNNKGNSSGSEFHLAAQIQPHLSLGRRPFSFANFIYQKDTQYRTSILLPLPPRYGNRGGYAIGITVETAEGLAALHAIDTLCALSIPVCKDPRAQAAFVARRAARGRIIPQTSTTASPLSAATAEGSGSNASAAPPPPPTPLVGADGFYHIPHVNPMMRSPPGYREVPDTNARPPSPQEVWRIMLTDADDFDYVYQAKSEVETYLVTSTNGLAPPGSYRTGTGGGLVVPAGPTPRCVKGGGGGATNTANTPTTTSTSPSAAAASSSSLSSPLPSSSSSHVYTVSVTTLLRQIITNFFIARCGYDAAYEDDEKLLSIISLCSHYNGHQRRGPTFGVPANNYWMRLPTEFPAHIKKIPPTASSSSSSSSAAASSATTKVSRFTSTTTTSATPSTVNVNDQKQKRVKQNKNKTLRFGPRVVLGRCVTRKLAQKAFFIHLVRTLFTLGLYPNERPETTFAEPVFPTTTATAAATTTGQENVVDDDDTDDDSDGGDATTTSAPSPPSTASAASPPLTLKPLQGVTPSVAAPYAHFQRQRDQLRRRALWHFSDWDLWLSLPAGILVDATTSATATAAAAATKKSKAGTATSKDLNHGPNKAALNNKEAVFSGDDNASSTHAIREAEIISESTTTTPNTEKNSTASSSSSLNPSSSRPRRLVAGVHDGVVCMSTGDVVDEQAFPAAWAIRTHREMLAKLTAYGDVPPHVPSPNPVSTSVNLENVRR